MYFRILFIYLLTIMSCSTNSPSESAQVPLRSEIDSKYKWDLTVVYENDEAWRKELSVLEQLYPKMTSFKGKLLSNPQTLLSSLKLDEEINQYFGRLYHYASNSLNADLTNETYQVMVQEIRNIAIKSSQLNAFYVPELLEAEYSKIEEFMMVEPDLRLYEKQFKDIYIAKPYTLSENEERLLSMTRKLSGIPNEAYDIMKATDFTWGTFKDENNIELTMSEGRYGKYTKSPNRRVREDMYKALYVPFKESINTLSVLMKGNIDGNIFYSSARGYENALEAKMKGSGISTEIYKNLINSVNNNLQPLHRWASIKAKYLNLDKIKPFDTYAPLADYSREYTYEEAQEIVIGALQPLLQANNGELQAFTERMYQENLIDVFENQGKESGAYMSSTWGLDPRIKLNFAGTLDDIFTLAHELGHAYHSYLSQKNQPYPYYGYDTFNAEVASVTTESLLMDYLLDNVSNDEEKAVLLQNYIQNIGSTYYRQARFAEFELFMHESAENGQILTEDFLTDNFGKMYQKYWGPSMELTDEEAYSWSRIPHFYYNFYMYAYATSFAAGEKISERVQKEGQEGIDGFISFLSSGSSDYPVELLNLAGVDMTTSEPFEAVSRKMNQLMDELETILEKK
jgi:oligoendopeptidase F